MSKASSVFTTRAQETSSGRPLILHYGELFNYFIIYHSVTLIEIKDTINVIDLNHPQTFPAPPAHHVWSMEKSSSGNPVPGAKKVGDHFFDLSTGAFHWTP